MDIYQIGVFSVIFLICSILVNIDNIQHFVKSNMFPRNVPHLQNLLDDEIVEAKVDDNNDRIHVIETKIKVLEDKLKYFKALHDKMEIIKENMENIREKIELTTSKSAPEETNIFPERISEKELPEIHKSKVDQMKSFWEKH